MNKVREWLRQYPLSYVLAALLGGGAIGATVDSPSYFDKIVAMPDNAQVCADFIRSKQKPEEQNGD